MVVRFECSIAFLVMGYEVQLVSLHDNSAEQLTRSATSLLFTPKADGHEMKN